MVIVDTAVEYRLTVLLEKVTEGVDEGEVISSVAYSNRCNSKDELYSKLKQSSLEAWLWFLKGKL